MMHPKKIRKIRICIFHRGNYYSFCWIEFLENGSFSLGFLSQSLRFTEYGSAILRNGHFSEHTRVVTSGNVDIKQAISPHVTYHTPKLWQNKGIVHMKASNGVVDEFELDWFPVKKTEMLLCAYTGEIEKLDKDKKKKSRYRIIDVPPDVQCLRMEMVVYPRLPKYPKPAKVRHVPGIIGNIHGECPDYVLSCYFYNNEVVVPQLYYASE
jgi:hypothetical protein